jgi:hypothetical protein
LAVAFTLSTFSNEKAVSYVLARLPRARFRVPPPVAVTYVDTANNLGVKVFDVNIQANNSMLQRSMKGRSAGLPGAANGTLGDGWGTVKSLISCALT